MSSIELEQTALNEANAARAANEDDTSEIDEDIDFDEEAHDAAIRATEAELKALERVELKSMLTANGHALKEILRSEKVKAHYTSPLSTESPMSIEDILLEIPKEDLHEVGMVRDRIFMPAAFVQKWIIPAIRVRNALKEGVVQTPGGIETAMLFSIFDQSKELTRFAHW